MCCCTLVSNSTWKPKCNPHLRSLDWIDSHVDRMGFGRFGGDFAAVVDAGRSLGPAMNAGTTEELLCGIEA
jgi:hypothetical protein